MRAAEFRWGKLSKKQLTVLTWWQHPKYKDYDGIIADGSIRSGKTISMGFSFVVWAMSSFNGMKFAMCGKTIQALNRNVIVDLKRQLRSEGYSIKDRKTENLLIVTKGKVTNSFYLFGGKDESSKDLIQGVTLAGAFFDEVALMPESFVNQATARCSVDGSKFWFNCNPASPMHWFYLNWILKCRSRKMLYLHFMMSDNLTLTERIRQRYEKQYVGVFFQRYILGLWVMAEGLIFDMFNKDKHILKEMPQTVGDWIVSCDYGIQNATVFLLWRKIANSNNWLCVDEWRYSGRDEKKQKTDPELVDGLDELCEKWHCAPTNVIVDPSASSLIALLRKRGYQVRKAKNDVLEGIEDVATMLYQDRLFFMYWCKGVIEEFGLYAWDQKKAERGIDVPIKTNDHGCDACRYFVKTMRLVKRDKEPEVSNLLFY